MAEDEDSKLASTKNGAETVRNHEDSRSRFRPIAVAVRLGAVLVSILQQYRPSLDVSVGKNRLGIGPSEQMKKVVQKRRQLRTYFVCNVRSMLIAIRSGTLSLPMAVAAFIEEQFMLNLYIRYLNWRRDDRFVVHPVDGHRLCLDLEDEGLSRDLFLYGIREAKSTNVFKAELDRLSEQVSDPVVLEIGANIGYYATMEARALGENAAIHAIEPNPETAALLDRNIGLNDYEDRIHVDQSAIGDQDGVDVLDVSMHSNLSRIRAAHDHGQGDIVDSTEVPIRTVPTFLDEHEISPDSVSVIRMDVEGYEVEIFREMNAVLEAETPLLLFIELHRNLRSQAELKTILEKLDENQFQIVSAIGSCGVGWSGLGTELESYDEIYQKQFVGPVRLVAKRERADHVDVSNEDTR